MMWWLPLADGALSQTVDQDGQIRMGVDIDETRGDVMALNIDHLVALQRSRLPDAAMWPS